MSEYRDTGPGIGEIADRLGSRAEEFCREWLPQGTRSGNYWHCGDYDGGPGRSLAVHLSGPKRGKWTDYAESGREAFGDLIDIIELQDNVNKGEVVRRAKHWLGLPEREPVADRSDSGRKVHPSSTGSTSSDSAPRLWGRGQPIAGTLAEHYLVDRGITEFGPALRFHPTCFYRDRTDAEPRKIPALLCAITDLDGNVVGVNRIYLAMTGGRANVPDPKKVLGRLHGCAVRFGTPGDVLIVGEGVETMLSIKTALPHVPVDAALTAQHLSMYVPPNQVRSLWIARDAGRPGENAAHELERRMKAERPNLRVRQLMPRRDDFNTRLRQMGTRRLARRLWQVMDADSDSVPNVLRVSADTSEIGTPTVPSRH